MDNRKSIWADNIASMLRKTEVNLLRLQCSFSEQRFSACNSNRELLSSPKNEELKKKLLEERVQVSIAPSPSQVFDPKLKELEKLVQRKINEHQENIENLAEKLASLEESNEELQRLKGKLDERIDQIEKKCKEGIKNIEFNHGELVTVEHMTKVVDEVRAKGTELMKKMQREVDGAKITQFEEKNQVFSELENRVQESLKKLMLKSEIYQVKESIEQGLESRIIDIEGKVDKKIERLKKSYNKVNNKVENELNECENSMKSVLSSLNSKLGTLEDYLTESKKQDQDVYSSFKSDIDRIEALVDTSAIQAKIHLLEKNLKKSPKIPDLDLSEYIEKTELNQWMKKYEKVLKEKKMLEIRVDDLEQKLIKIEKNMNKVKKNKNHLVTTKEFSVEGITTFGKPAFLGSSSVKSDFSLSLNTFSMDVIKPHKKPKSKIEELPIIHSSNPSEKLLNDPKNENFFNFLTINQEENKDFPAIGKNVFSSFHNSSESDRSGQKINANVNEIFRPPMKTAKIENKVFGNSKVEEPNQDFGQMKLAGEAFEEFVEDEIEFCCILFKDNMYPLQISPKKSGEDGEGNKKHEMQWMKYDTSSSSEEESESSSVCQDLFK